MRLNKSAEVRWERCQGKAFYPFFCLHYGIITKHIRSQEIVTRWVRLLIQPVFYHVNDNPQQGQEKQ